MIDYDNEAYDLVWVSTVEEENGLSKVVSRPIKMLRKKPDTKDFLAFIKKQPIGYQMINPTISKEI